ncbi:hypothetical protein R9C00_25170 [Flammeovirgaceae bacterium SG7u.111]|nr:hypothetical protein [Flammeovirgaceae bacterium SG7u.132]WPO34989.1 hypothetical protein R9C00_25170 [Flammeovirgaceae bacterium SG7u.111]
MKQTVNSQNNTCAFAIYPAIVAFAFLLFSSCSPKEEKQSVSNHNTPNRILNIADFKSLNPINKRLSEANPGEWLYTQKENGQSFKEYINSQPVRPNSRQNKIYLKMLGEFDTVDFYVIEMLSEYLDIFLGLETIIMEPVSDSIIPAYSRRIHMDIEQLHTKYILDSILVPSIPADAITYMALTSKDLYPKKSWNFVFGQASLKNRIGVSIQE